MGRVSFVLFVLLSTATAVALAQLNRVSISINHLQLIIAATSIFWTGTSLVLIKQKCLCGKIHPNLSGLQTTGIVLIVMSAERLYFLFQPLI